MQIMLSEPYFNITEHDRDHEGTPRVISIFLIEYKIIYEKLFWI